MQTEVHTFPHTLTADASTQQPDEPGLFDQEAECPVMICLLGKFQVLKQGRPVSMQGAKAEALLCALATQPQYRIERAALLQMLWPDYDTKLARHSLNTLMHKVRDLFGEAIAGAPPVQYDSGHYYLDAGAGIGVDTNCFDELAALGECQDRAGDEAASILTYRRAVLLYRGDYRSGMDPHALDADSMMERNRLRTLYLALLIRVANYGYDNGRYGACLESTSRILAADPYREDAHRTMMRCFALLGQRSQAFHQYELCAQMVRTRFDTRPEPATQELYERIRLDPGSIEPTYHEMRLD
jgi:DNA-binding SARP family transcriptional activator